MQEDVNCVFNITNDYYAKRIFDTWQTKIIDNTKFHINYDNEFKTTVTIQQLDESDKPVYETVLLGAYPVSVQPLVFDNNAEQQTQKLSVLFAYNDFKQNKILIN
jgi:hypothetical protein